MVEVLLISWLKFVDYKMQGLHPCTPLKGLFKKSLKNPQNLNKASFIY
jgi:hypothetical protein